MMKAQTLVLSSVLALAACGGGSSDADPDAALKVTGTVTAAGDPAAQRVSLDMKDDLTFVPNVVNARPGTLTVTLANVGRLPHNLVFDDSSLGKTGTVDGRDSGTLTVRLSKAGTYRFVCTFHSGMDGQVVVTG